MDVIIRKLLDLISTKHVTEAPHYGELSALCFFFFSLGDKEDDGALGGT